MSKRWVRSILLVVCLAAGAGLGTVLARVWDSWDWHIYYGYYGPEPKRHLHYCVDPDFAGTLPHDAIDWNEAVDDAAGIWNAQTQKTGWSLERVAWADSRCQILIKAGPVKNNDIALTECLPNTDKRVDRCTITVNPHHAYGKDNGSDAAATYNSRWTLVHEFGHTMRLDHSGSGQIMRPDVPRDGDDDLTLNTDDIQEAKDSLTAPIRASAAQITPAGGAHISINSWTGELLATVDVPQHAVGGPVDVVAGVDNYVSEPFGYDVPNMTSVIRSVYLRDSLGQPIPLLQPATIDIYYADMFNAITGDIREAISTVVPIGSGLPGVCETSLEVVVRTEVQPGVYVWIQSATPTIDTTQHKATFQAVELRTYGLSGGPDGDCDGVVGSVDNCPLLPNPNQRNSDNVIGNGATLAQQGKVDVTVPNADSLGDACDDDMDNDGIPNDSDPHPGGDITYDDNNNGNPCQNMGTDAADNGPSWDWNCNGVLDGREVIGGPCATGKLLTNPDGDDDNDGLLNTWEVCKWGTYAYPSTSPLCPAAVGCAPVGANPQDTDGDGIKDCKEAVDTDGNGVVDFGGDALNSARATLLPAGIGAGKFGKDGDFDLNGNGVLLGDYGKDTLTTAKMALHVLPCQ